MASTTSEAVVHAASSVTQAKAEVPGAWAGSFYLDWPIVDVTAREVLYLAVGGPSDIAGQSLTNATLTSPSFSVPTGTTAYHVYVGAASHIAVGVSMKVRVEFSDDGGTVWALGAEGERVGTGTAVPFVAVAFRPSSGSPAGRLMRVLVIDSNGTTTVGDAVSGPII